MEEGRIPRTGVEYERKYFATKGEFTVGGCFYVLDSQRVKGICLRGRYTHRRRYI